MLSLQVDIENLLLKSQNTELEQEVLKVAAQVYVAQKEWEKALAILPQIEQPNAEVFFLKGGCLIEKEDRGGANLTYLEGLSLYPDNPNLLQGHASNLINLGEPDLALGYIKTLIEVAPKNLIGYLLNAEVLISKKQHSQALSALQLAEVNCGEIGLVGENLKGSCYGQLGEEEKACEAFARAVSYDEQFYPGWFNLALGLSKLGREEEATLALQRLPGWVVDKFLEQTKSSAATSEAEVKEDEEVSSVTE